MALKKSGVRVSLAPFFLAFACFADTSPAISQTPPPAVPELVLYVLAPGNGSIQLSIAYRDKLAGTRVNSDLSSLAARISLSSAQRPVITTDRDGNGATVTSASLSGAGSLPVRDGIPDPVPLIEALRTHARFEIVIPRDVSFRDDPREFIADNEAYSLRWARSSDGAFQYSVWMKDKSKPVMAPMYKAVGSLTKNNKTQPLDAPIPETQSSNSAKLLMLAAMGGIFLIGGVMLMVRRGRPLI